MARTVPLGRLSREEEFRRVYREGARCAKPLLVVHARPNERDVSRAGAVRLGVVVSRRFGQAVARNRLRRRLREAVRAHAGQVRAGVDMVVVPRAAAAKAGYDALLRAVGGALAEAGLLGDAPVAGR